MPPSFDPPPGAPPATRLVFLHGAACGPWVWSGGFAQRLAAAGHPGVALEMARIDASLADYVEEARAALTGPTILVGHSLGALVAQRLLDHRMVRGAVLLAPVPPEGLWWSNSRLAMADPGLWGEVAQMTMPGTQPSPHLAEALFGPRMDRAEALRLLGCFGAESGQALMEAQLPQPVSPGWIHGRPVLVLGATEDRLIPADAVRRCAGWHGTSAAFLPETGHLMMLDAGWEALADRVGEWVAAKAPAIA